MNTVEARFEQYVHRTSTCWLWTSAISCGYGVLRINYKDVKAHRLSYELYCGYIPSGMMVLHTCDVRNCVNPQHLYLGTHKDNMQDKVDRDRAAKGEYNGNSTLTTEQVEAIRKDKRPSRAVAKDFGCSKSTINRIMRGITWT